MVVDPMSELRDEIGELKKDRQALLSWPSVVNARAALFTVQYAWVHLGFLLASSRLAMRTMMPVSKALVTVFCYKVIRCLDCLKLPLVKLTSR